MTSLSAKPSDNGEKPQYPLPFCLSGVPYSGLKTPHHLPAWWWSLFQDALWWKKILIFVSSTSASTNPDRSCTSRLFRKPRKICAYGTGIRSPTDKNYSDQTYILYDSFHAFKLNVLWLVFQIQIGWTKIEQIKATLSKGNMKTFEAIAKQSSKKTG